MFRVTVRGRFHELTDRALRYLVTTQGDHDIFRSAYTPEGTFTFDERILFFNLRYELREYGADAAATAEMEGLDEAQRFLETMGFGYTGLRATVVDMSTMTVDGAERPIESVRPDRGDEL